MAKITEELVNDPNLEENDLDDCLEPEDYVFVVGPDGKMKSVILPAEEVFEYSPQLLKVFAAIGIDNPELLTENQTLH